MFVLYKICILQYTSKDEEGADVLLEYCPVILQLSLDALMKIQRDDVRLNCLGLSLISKTSCTLYSSLSAGITLQDCNTCRTVLQGQY